MKIPREIMRSKIAGMLESWYKNPQALFLRNNDEEALEPSRD